MRFLKWGLMLMFLTLAFFSCKDDESILGENFLDGTLGIFYDTVIDVSTRTVEFDDTTRYLSGVTTSLIGDYFDPIFGDHKSLSAFDFVPQSNSIDDGTYTAYSVTMYLDYKGTFYGFDTLNPTTFSIHRVIDSLGQIDGQAQSAVDIHQFYDPNPLAEVSYVLDSATRASDNFLKFELPVSLAEELIENFDKIDNDSLFLTYFYGFVIKAERDASAEGTLVSFDYTDTDTRLELEFYEAESPDDTLLFKYYVSNSDNTLPTHRYNFFEHVYSTGEIIQNMTSTDPPQFIENDQYLFLQAMRGLNIEFEVNMADVEFFSNSDIIINRAFLKLYTTKREGPLVPFEGDSTKQLEYFPPSSIVLDEIENGAAKPVLDYLVPSSELSYAQGYNTTDDSYDIVLSRLTYENIVEGDEDYTILVSPISTNVSPYRAVVFGSGYTVDSLRPKVFITYSKRTNN